MMQTFQSELNMGLLRQALVEATGGFAAKGFPAAERALARELFERLSADPAMNPSLQDARVFELALRFALKELGPEEFQTITGYDFDEGEATLKQLEERARQQDR